MRTCPAIPAIKAFVERDEYLTARALLVLLDIAAADRAADTTGSSISARTDLSPQTVARQLRALERADLIRRQEGTARPAALTRLGIEMSRPFFRDVHAA